ILGKNVYDGDREYTNQEQTENHNPGENQARNMLFRSPEPPIGKGKQRGYADEDDHNRKYEKRETQVPQEKFPSGVLPSAPAGADAALARKHAIEEYEAHDAADICEHHKKDEPGDHEDGDQRSKDSRIDLGKAGPRRLIRALEGRRKIKASSQFAGQKTNECQLDPLREAKWLRELTLGMLERQRDRVDGGDRQRRHLANHSSQARYCLALLGANRFLPGILAGNSKSPPSRKKREKGGTIGISIHSGGLLPGPVSRLAWLGLIR